LPKRRPYRCPPRNHPLVVLTIDTVTTRTVHRFHGGIELRAERTTSPTPLYTAQVLEQQRSNRRCLRRHTAVIVGVDCLACGLTTRDRPGRLPSWARLLYGAVQNSA
jgi:hypothetical protein